MHAGEGDSHDHAEEQDSQDDIVALHTHAGCAFSNRMSIKCFPFTSENAQPCYGTGDLITYTTLELSCMKDPAVLSKKRPDRQGLRSLRREWEGAVWMWRVACPIQ